MLIISKLGNTSKTKARISRREAGFAVLNQFIGHGYLKTSHVQRPFFLRNRQRHSDQ